MLRPDQVLNQGRYRIISALGDHGSDDAMYEAFDTVGSTNVLLHERVVQVGRVASPSQINAINTAFASEARILTAIRHESLTSIQDHFSEIDRQYLVFDSAADQRLEKYIEQTGSKPAVAEVLSWMEQVLSGLEHLHRLLPPVIHGDVRPANLIVAAGGKVKLLFTRASTVNSPTDRAAMTARNYKPLEQLWPDIENGVQQMILSAYDEKAVASLLRPLDPRSDIYSVGATFYHILTGTIPPDAVERTQAMVDRRRDSLVRPSDLDSHISTDISDALMRAMSIRREDRFDVPVIMRQVLRTAMVRAKERDSGLLEIPNDLPAQKEIPKNPMRDTHQSTFDPTSPEANLELRQQLFEDRQRELEAEQAKLEEERNKIEQRRLELEAEKERHAAELERVRQEAAQAERRAEEERRRLEKERLEQEVAKERQKIAEKLAAFEAEAERERVEQERVEREAEAERRRAELKLQELKAEQELRRAEQERIKEQAKKELEETERRLLALSNHLPETTTTDVNISKPGFESASPVENEIVVPDFGGGPTRSGRSWRVPAIGAAALLAVVGTVAWIALPAGDGASATSTVAQRPSVASDNHSAELEPIPVSEQTQIDPTANNDAWSTASLPIEDPVATSPQNEPAAPAGEPSAISQRRPQISAVQERQKKAAGEKPVLKKKVTVDDLINDN